MQYAITTLLIISVFIHASSEFKNNLSDYLGSIVGIRNPKWFKYILWILAVLNIIIPFVLGLNKFMEAIMFSYVIGGLLGDSLSTHVIPSLFFKKTSPGIFSVPLYIILAILIYTEILDLNMYALTLGILSFVLLWPSLITLRYLKVFPDLHKS